ncbi:hypothetical protein [Streptomyces coerulescens]|uniref:Uncharacterized protein n=1 Tax=Streptomyces coerulescens TaxID=29304 RepID=A0ABW0CV68_STRCD
MTTNTRCASAAPAWETVRLPGAAFLMESGIFSPEERPMRPVLDGSLWVHEHGTGRAGRRPQRRDTAPQQHRFAGRPVCPCAAGRRP